MGVRAWEEKPGMAVRCPESTQYLERHFRSVTFRKGVTPRLPFEQLGNTIMPDLIFGLLVAC
jgi:hypothetical protein